MGSRAIDLFDENGIEARAVNKSNTAMVVALYNRDAFMDEVGQVEYQGNETIGVDLKRLREILRTRVPKDANIIGFQLQEDGKLDATIDEDLKFTIALLNPDTIRKEPSSFTKHFSALTVLGVKEFQEAISTASKMDENIKFTADDDTKLLTIRAESDIGGPNGSVSRKRMVEYAFNSLQYDLDEAAFMTGSPYVQGSDNPLDSLFHQYRAKRRWDCCGDRTGPATYPWEEAGMPLVRDEDEDLQLYLAVTEAMAHCAILDGLDHLSRSTCRYGAEYLGKIARGLRSVAGANASVEFEMNRDYPARISAGNDMASVSYLLAPRIEE
jgi:hypothetical protein